MIFSASPALTDPKKTLIGERRKRLEELNDGLTRGLSRAQEQRKHALTAKTMRLMGARFLLVGDGKRKQIDALSMRLDRAMERKIRDSRSQTETLSRMLESLNPANVLERGYAAVYVKNQAVSDASGVAAGETIKIRMRDGELYAKAISEEYGEFTFRLYHIGENEFGRKSGMLKLTFGDGCVSYDEYTCRKL